MTNQLALQALLSTAPKSHHGSIKRAFDMGKRTATISHQNATREALRELFRAANMDVENETSI